MTQLMLFDMQEQADLYGGTKHPAQPLVPAPIGSGPAGQTCGTCGHRVHVSSGENRYQKCALVRRHWTHGEGADIKAAWSACRYWKPKEVDLADPD